MNAQMFSFPWKSVHAQNKARQHPCDAVLQKGVFSETEGFGVSSCGFLKPVSQSRERGDAVFTDFSVADRKFEIRCTVRRIRMFRHEHLLSSRGSVALVRG